MIVLYSNDLVFASRFRFAAEDAGVEWRMALSMEQAISLVDAGSVAGVFVDLEASGLQLRELVERVRQAGAGRVVAYGPHVHEDKLQAAHDAGCDRVMTRGQFDRELPQLVAEFSNGS